MENQTSSGSLYELIKESCIDGKLPQDFSLPQEDKGQLRFADGAMDGILMYHMTGDALAEEEKNRMQEIIRLISDGETMQADIALAEFAKKHRALSVIDDFENTIQKNSHQLNIEKLYRYGVRLITGSADKECVKFGLEILEVFQLKNEQLKDVIRVLGLSDEFTLFVIFIMMKWQNSNEEIFHLAQKVAGWGRIHAVEKLQPQSEEIRAWLLEYGICNSVMPEYSALTCFEKAKVKEKLDKTVSYREFRSIGRILQAMLQEGPVPGISAVEAPFEVINRYLMRANEQNLTLSDYEIIHQIYHYGMDRKPAAEEICRLSMEILSSAKCMEAVKESVIKGEGILLAKALGVEYQGALWNRIRDDFDNNYYKIRYLFDEEAYVDAAIQLFSQRLPLEKMASGPAEEHGFGEAFAEYQKLDCILQELKDTIGKGEVLIKTGLYAPVIHSRNMALNVITAWMEMEKKSIREISGHLYAALEDVVQKEVNQEIQIRMQTLLEGKGD